MYITLLPVIIAGIFNMILCKSSALNILNMPIDGNRKLSDGRRIFGENKTWKGFVGYLIVNVICMVLFGLISNENNFLSSNNIFYINHNNTVIYNIFIGFLLGLGYALFELPNSFIKRRIGIKPGKTATGLTKVIFVFIDQADSVFGCVLVVCLFYKMSLLMYSCFVLLGAMTHIVINMLLFSVKLRKNLF